MSIKQLLRDMGVIGAGGAGFPTYAKLAEGADVYLINGAECEPLLDTDYVLLSEHMEDIAAGARAVTEAFGIRETVLCLKGHKAARLGLSDGDVISDTVRVAVVPDVYPMGDEINLIYQVLGRLVRPGALPITAGVIVNNVETVFNVSQAVYSGVPVVSKTLTVAGATGGRSYVVTVPVGTSVQWLLVELGLTVPENCVLIDGGPSMGRVIDRVSATVKKTTKGILILPEDAAAVRSMRRTIHANHLIASSACCQCTRCTDLCPRTLLGYPLAPHLMVRSMVRGGNVDLETLKYATLCCGCGVCETMACCQGISPKAVINEYKAYMAKEKMRFTADPSVDYHPVEGREYRQLPIERWEQHLGVYRYHRDGDRYELDSSPRKVRIFFGGHIGAPSAPIVTVGDRVQVGDMIAEASEGLSVAQHASISGMVTSIDRTSLTIEQER